MKCRQKNKISLYLFRTILLGLIGTFCHHAKCQDQLNSDQFFRNSIIIPPSIHTQYQRQTISLPWIETYELRTESDEFDFNRQKYTARFTPTSPAVRKAQSALFHHYRRKLSLVEASYINSKIEEAYEFWIDLYFNKKILSVYEKILQVNQDKLKVYKKLVESEDFDFTILIDTQQKINELFIKIKELQISINTKMIQSSLVGKSISLEDMITVDEISHVLNNQRNSDLIDVDYFYENELLNKEIALERAEKRKIFDFIQIEYGGPHEEVLNERISLGLGLKIPTYGKKNLKIEEIRIEQQQLDFEHQIKKKEVAEDITGLLIKVQSKIEIYKSLEVLRTSQQNAYQEISTFVANESGEDPIILLKIIEAKEKISLEDLERQKEIFEEYIEYLVLSSKLFDRPLKNYLKGSPNQIEILKGE
jgi:hypothetical protein